MRLSNDLIDLAFEKHGQVYNSEGLWNIQYHVDCWARARLAFDKGSFEDFEWLYGELKRRWQALRGAQSAPWTARQTFDHLQSLDDRRWSIALRDMTDADVRECWNLLQGMSGLKPLKYGPSVVAISKFLHFWNPHLIVIVDDAVIWRWVFGHRWLRQAMLKTRKRIAPLVGASPKRSTYGACDLLSYLAIMRWCGEVMRANPGISKSFDAHVRRYAQDTTIDLPIEQYDAAAMEWLLLGLVEIRPAGIEDLDDY